MASWTSEAQVLELTGATVTSAHLTQAQGVIDIYSGITLDYTDEINLRNRRLLAAATAYQAAWMVRQIDVTTRTDVSKLNQEGVQFDLAHEDALLLAPLAKRCLDRLSWRGSGSLCVASQPVLTPLAQREALFLSDGTRGLGACDGDWAPR